MVLKVDNEFHLGILVDTRPKDTYEDFGKLTLSDEMNEEWNKDPPVGKIIECRYSKTWPNNWQFSRFRPDKNTSNFITVYEKIIKSINDNISKDQVHFGMLLFFSCWESSMKFTKIGKSGIQRLQLPEISMIIKFRN